MFVVLALAAVACAEPEADPALVYSGVYSPLSYTSGYSPLLRSFTPYSGFNTFGTNYFSHHGLMKRDAEADPLTIYQASPYTNVLGATPMTYTYPSVVNSHSLISPYSSIFGLHHTNLVKREAEADPVTVYHHTNPYPITTFGSPLYSSFMPQMTYATNLYHSVMKREADAEPGMYYTAAGFPATTTYTGLPATTYTGIPATTYGSVFKPVSYAYNPVRYSHLNNLW